MNYIKKIVSLKKYKFMLLQLVKRDFKVRYRGSFLGILWSVLNPLLNMLVLSFVFSRVFKAVDNYKMYLLSGLVIFNYFSEASNLALSSVVNNFGLLTKVYFPKFILPISKIVSSAINLFMSILAFFILGHFMDVHFWWGYLFIPYILLCLMIFTIGIGMILAALQVFMRDIQYLYGILLTIWMYATPILYPLTTDVIPESMIPILQQNPLFLFIDFFRKVTLYSSIPSTMDFLRCAVTGLISLLLGLIVFKKTQDNFIYYT